MNEDQLAAEQRARARIGRQLVDAGWCVQDRADLNLYAGQGVAVREVIMKPGHGRADYLLYVDKCAIGVIEARPVGTPLSGVEWQSAMYAEGLPAEVRLKAMTHDGRLPFAIEASGTETHFTNGFDPVPRSRRIFAVPRPETLALAIRDAGASPDLPTWRAKVTHMPALDERGLRPAQITAITGTEKSLAKQQHSRSLIQMATGAGKTFTAVTQCYRLLKYGGFRRVLFLVDRNNLSDQTPREFQNYTTPDDGRRFTELYNADKLTGAGMVGSSHVVISTIQRVFAALGGNEVADVDDPGVDGYIPDEPVTVVYNAAMPPESFDLVIVDEAHRSIYGVWRGVLEYFDAHILGGVHLCAVGGRQGQRRLRRLPDLDGDHRHRFHSGSRHGGSDAGQANPPGAVPDPRRRPDLHGRSARPRRHRTIADPARAGDLPATGCSPRSSPAAPPCRRR